MRITLNRISEEYYIKLKLIKVIISNFARRKSTTVTVGGTEHNLFIDYYNTPTARLTIFKQLADINAILPSYTNSYYPFLRDITLQSNVQLTGELYTQYEIANSTGGINSIYDLSNDRESEVFSLVVQEHSVLQNRYKTLYPILLSGGISNVEVKKDEVPWTRVQINTTGGEDYIPLGLFSQREDKLMKAGDISEHANPYIYAMLEVYGEKENFSRL